MIHSASMKLAELKWPDVEIRPDLVGEHQRDEVPKGTALDTTTRGWTTKDRSEPGHIGVPAAANAEKGETLFTIFTDGAVKLIEEMCNWDGQSWD